MRKTKNNKKNNNKFNENDFKCLFINSQTLTMVKLQFLITLLLQYHVIFLSEVNYQQQLLTTIDDDFCQYHFDPATPRLAMICRQSMNFEYKSIGKIIEQPERIFDDKTCFQSNLYRFNVRNLVFEAENCYMLPDTFSQHIETVRDHFYEQGDRSVPYFCGGDLNINWLNTAKKNKLKNPNLKQIVTDFTRVRKYFHQKSNSQRTSKTIIDLIFANQTGQNRVVNTEIMKTENLPFFDHNGVILKLDFKPQKPYKDVRIPIDPFRRPDPTESQLDQINAELAAWCVSCPDDYDCLMIGFKQILDSHIPCPNIGGFYTKRFYDHPYPKAILKEIALKQKFAYDYRMNPTDVNRLAKNIQRNKVTSLCRKFRCQYIENKIKNQPNINAIQKTFNFLTKKPKVGKPNEIIVIDGKYGTELANHMSDYFKERANLVPDSEMIKCPNLENNFSIDEVPNQTLTLTKFPPISDFEKTIPNKKVTKTGSFDGISSYTLKMFWPVMANKFNKCFDQNLKYPCTSQGYYQRVISKKDDKQPTVLKDMRPLGVLNTLPKYHMSKYVFTELRNHVGPILRKRKIYTYKGCVLAIFATMDKVLYEMYLKFFVILTKYDFSNAFGTLRYKRLIMILDQLNVCSELRQFVIDYFLKQKMCQTIFTDPVYGNFISDLVEMNVGGPQGQVGMDVAFTIQQMGLKAIIDIWRAIYMDDLNDITEKCKTEKEAITLANNNENELNKQSVSVGFMKNAGKTTFIPMNVPESELIKHGVDEKSIKTTTDLLGFPIKVNENGFSVDKAASDIIWRIQSNLNIVHSSRDYIKSHLERVKLGRTIVFHSMTWISLIAVYGETRPTGTNRYGNNRLMDKIKVKVNDVFRATGLRKNTPVYILEKCMGVDILKFAEHAIILNGLKAIRFESDDHEDIFDRISKIRPKGIFNVFGTLKNRFMRVWNDLEHDKRTMYKTLEIDKIKDILKKERTLFYDDSIFKDYKWVSLKNQIQV